MADVCIIIVGSYRYKRFPDMWATLLSLPVGFTVVSIDDKAINTIVDHDGILGENKVVVVHGVDERAIDMHFMTYEDTVDVDFAMRHGVEIIAANYVNKPTDIDEVRRLPGVTDRGLLVFAKIETKQAIENAEAIIQAADGIVLPRSDIAVDMPIEQVAHAQKILIRLANLHGKPIFIANQILNSMVQNPRPTRAECTDIANAVLEGADGIILTDTTAIGKYPLETVEMSRRQFAEVERAYPHRKKYTEIRNYMLDRGSTSIAESIASSAVKTSWDLDSTMLIVVTRSGAAVQKLAKYKGHAPILVATSNEIAARAVQAYGGAIPIVISADKLKGEISLDLFKELARTAIGMGFVREGEYVIAVWGKSPDIDDLFQYQVIQV
jgi:pyruvate kinase